MIIEQRFTINYHYNIHFINDVFNAENETFHNILANNSARGFTPTLLFVIDENVLIAHPTLLSDIKKYLKQSNHNNPTSHFITIPGGEKAKENDGTFKTILEAINQFNIDRHSFIISIGGGAVCDVTGFASTVAHRGIKLIRIPTTTLAQNDAAIGVKNGINTFGKKNFIGTFSTPVAVINDSTFLKTLPYKIWISGISEAIKVALIKDVEFFERIEQLAPFLNQMNAEAMQETIIECAKLHLQHISNGDPFESGSSRPLDFGHWSAHKLEQMSGYRLIHGEAVAIGISLDCIYANMMGYLDADALDRIIGLFRLLNLPTWHPLLNNYEELLVGLNEFKEHLGGILTIPLLKGLGISFNVSAIDNRVLQQAVKKLETIGQNTLLQNSL